MRRGVGGPVGMRKGIKLRMGYEAHAVEWMIIEKVHQSIEKECCTLEEGLGTVQDGRWLLDRYVGSWRRSWNLGGWVKDM